MIVRYQKELKDYGPPTFKTYERECDQFVEWMKQAAALPLSDIRRHASVSTSNRHSCQNCFCCAALAVLRSTAGENNPLGSGSHTARELYDILYAVRQSLYLGWTVRKTDGGQ